jgi:hypothetical protein
MHLPPKCIGGKSVNLPHGAFSWRFELGLSQLEIGVVGVRRSNDVILEANINLKLKNMRALNML